MKVWREIRIAIKEAANGTRPLKRGCPMIKKPSELAEEMTQALKEYEAKLDWHWDEGEGMNSWDVKELDAFQVPEKVRDFLQGLIDMGKLLVRADLTFAHDPPEKDWYLGAPVSVELDGKSI